MIFQIDSAISLRDMQECNVDGEPGIGLRENPEYAYATLHDDMLFASKDGREFFLALAVRRGEKMYTLRDLLEEDMHL